MNIVFVCHDGATSQSSYHVLSIAERLHVLGHRCIVCIPPAANGDFSRYRATTVPTRNFDQALAGDLTFPDGHGPTLIHAWTPREQVRRVTMALAERYGCPHFVHLEDNEREILSRELDGISYQELAALPADQQDAHIQRNRDIRIHPARHWEFLRTAAGCTVLIERLKEHVPPGTPVQLFWPGYDDGFAELAEVPRQTLRRQFGIPGDDFVVFYAGAFHAINHDEISQMVTALKVLVNRGMPLTFVKTGHNDFPDLLARGIRSGWVRDLGFLPRSRLPELYRTADALIQPGRSDPFNDYRFPSKLPEALAQAVPVILPRSNLGLALRDGIEALVTDDDSMERLIDRILYLYEHPTEREQIGRNGRVFCMNHLSWDHAARIIASFYEACLKRTPAEFATREPLRADGRPVVAPEPTGDRRNPSLHGPISPHDLFLLFQEEQGLKGKGTVLAAGRWVQSGYFSPLLQRSQRKLRKYRTLYVVELLIILVLLAILILHA